MHGLGSDSHFMSTVPLKGVFQVKVCMYKERIGKASGWEGSDKL